MRIDNIELDDVRTYTDGRFHLFVGLCEKIGLIQIMNKHIEKATGRPMDLPPGIEAMILMAPMVDEGYKPLYQLNDYYRSKDLEGIFHFPVNLEHIVDNRFGYFLDTFHKAGCRSIFSEICTNALVTYGITIERINYDTTSRVMWGEYKTVEGKTGVINIDFGHSKDHRPDKKQIKIGIGTANGTIVDAKVLSGNEDDKTYNKNNIEDVDQLLNRLEVDKANFYYISDSALFGEKSIGKMKEANIKFITRVPDNVKEANALIETGVGDAGKKVIYQNSHKKDVEYHVLESTGEYKGYPLKYAIVYSTALEPAKEKSINKNVKSEKDRLDREIKECESHKYACLEDAERAIKKMRDKNTLRSKFHSITICTKTTEKKPQGRPFGDSLKNKTTTEYHIDISYNQEDAVIKEAIRKGSTFILTSNDLEISAESMLMEYKTQSGVEKKFQQLKNPHFVDSIYLEKPERIEALSYIILLTIMMLSVMEQVVRKGLKEEKTTVVGTGRMIKTQPTQVMILRIFYNILYQCYYENKKRIRRLLTPLDDSQAKIIRYLGLDASIFAWNSG